MWDVVRDAVPAERPAAIRAQGFLCEKGYWPALKHSTAYEPEKWGAVGGLPIFLHGAGVLPAVQSDTASRHNGQ